MRRYISIRCGHTEFGNVYPNHCLPTSLQKHPEREVKDRKNGTLEKQNCKWVGESVTYFKNCEAEMTKIREI